MLLAEKSTVQRLPWGGRSEGLSEAHKRAKKGAHPEVEIRPSRTQVNLAHSGPHARHYGGIMGFLCRPEDRPQPRRNPSQYRLRIQAKSRNGLSRMSWKLSRPLLRAGVGRKASSLPDQLLIHALDFAIWRSIIRNVMSKARSERTRRMNSIVLANPPVA